jgi:hypothetical protein
MLMILLAVIGLRPVQKQAIEHEFAIVANAKSFFSVTETSPSATTIGVSFPERRRTETDKEAYFSDLERRWLCDCSSFFEELSTRPDDQNQFKIGPK